MQVAGYTIQERIGSGGMGEVFKAYHPGLGRTAAVKMLYQKEMAARFENEALIQASIQHPNMARVYEYCQSGGRLCIVMEYVEGPSLDQYLQSKGRLGNEELIRILTQVAGALQHLHSRGIMHRDIKPQNFKLEPGGQVKMLDFGIARKNDAPRMTQMGFVVGTTEYMAPEQFRQVQDRRGDVWSLGVMAYELATGYLPFESTDAADLRTRIQRGHYTPPRVLAPQLAPALERMIEGALRVTPSSRLSIEEIQLLLKDGEGTKSEHRIIKHKRYLGYGAAAIGGILLLALLLANTGSGDAAVMPVADTLSPEEAIHIKVNVPSISGATLVLPDGSQRATPYDLEGREGQTEEFTIHADGYADKKVRLVITPRRRTYEYHLEKLNQ